VLLIVLAGCSFHWPRVAHVPVQQGNVITQEMIAKLKPGLTRRQVAYIMGEPVLRDTFNSNRWDYVHSYQIGKNVYQAVHVSIFFTDDVLASFSGNFAPVANAAATPAAPTAPETPAEPAKDSEFDSPENNPVINDAPTG
jgi:outer membrane protein assembly factor BamE